MFARTMADVDGDEDAELQRLERGAADDDAGVLLFEAAALLDGTRGVVRLHPNRLEWISDGAAKASVQLEVAHVASFQQSKAGKPNPKLKVTATPAAGGVSFVFDMTEADPTSTAERDRLRDTLKAQMDAVGLFAAAGASGAARAAGAIGSSGGGGGGLSSAASASSLAAVPPARPHQPMSGRITDFFSNKSTARSGVGAQSEASSSTAQPPGPPPPLPPEHAPGAIATDEGGNAPAAPDWDRLVPEHVVGHRRVAVVAALRRHNNPELLSKPPALYNAKTVTLKKDNGGLFICPHCLSGGYGSKGGVSMHVLQCTGCMEVRKRSSFLTLLDLPLIAFVDFVSRPSHGSDGPSCCLVGPAVRDGEGDSD